MISYGLANSIFGKRALLGQVVLEPRIVLIIVIYHAISLDTTKPQIALPNATVDH